MGRRPPALSGPRLNNFPGTIYQFWGLGKVFGWGCVPAFYVADVALLVVLLATLVVWSRARFGRALPGPRRLLDGPVVLSLHRLQPDRPAGLARVAPAGRGLAHRPDLAATGLGRARGGPRRVGRFAHPAPGRPFLPALVAVIVEVSRRAGPSWRKTAAVVAAWMAVLAAVTALGFLPLARAGVLDDFVRGVRMVAYGRDYNAKSVRQVVSMFIDDINNFRVLSVLISVVFLSYSARQPGLRHLVVVWLAALAGVLFYSPLSPRPSS